MPPRGFTNPAPKTESAREAVKSFYCDLCSKGYARMNEFEAHESSYDHQHKKRLKEMKALQRDPTLTARARERERRAEEKSSGLAFKPVKLTSTTTSSSNTTTASNNTASKTVSAGGGGFKKGGFKNAFGGEKAVVDVAVKLEEEDEEVKEGGRKEGKGGMGVRLGEGEESETDEEDYYDPRVPTECGVGCPGWVGVV